MKKMILTILITCMLIGGVLAYAAPMPYPIFVKVTALGLPAQEGLAVVIENTNCGVDCVKARTFYTNSDGEIALDAYDSERGFYGFKETDVFKATLMYCKDEALCVKTMNFKDEGGSMIFTFDLTNVEACSPIIACPACPEPQTIEVIKEVEKIVEIPAECPEQETGMNYIISLIVSAIAGMGIYKYGFGVKIYTKTDGTISKTHKHRNVRGYHDTKTYHKKEPHPRGKVDVKYSDTKNSAGVYKYIG